MKTSKLEPLASSPKRSKKTVYFSQNLSKSLKNKNNILTSIRQTSKKDSSDENYEKNYCDLMSKSYLEKVYKVPQYVINNKEKILLASSFEEPKMMLGCKN